MPWYYSQSTGQLTRNERVAGIGYAGAGGGRNNPRMENVRDVGPIPRGTYQISRPRNSERRGPHVMDLSPVGHNALGRTNFLIHGDSARHPGQASQGCIILPRLVRQQISGSGDNRLIVIE